MRVSIDTNILVRSFLDDGTAQFRAVAELMRENEIVIPPTVLLETEWVLRDAFELAREKVADAFEALLGASNVTVLQGDAAVLALGGFRGGCDFADAFHLALSAGTDVFFTFDRRFVRRAAALGLQPTVQPLAAAGKKSG
jgi:predicted nucleic-acid-binding protein